MTILLEHGTQLHQLKPSSIVSAAEADLQLRDRKICKEVAPTAPYSFHRAHVRQSESAIELLKRAVRAPDVGIASHKVCTRVIYSDVEMIRAALVIAERGTI